MANRGRTTTLQRSRRGIPNIFEARDWRSNWIFQLGHLSKTPQCHITGAVMCNHALQTSDRQTHLVLVSRIHTTLFCTVVHFHVRGGVVTCYWRQGASPISQRPRLFEWGWGAKGSDDRATTTGVVDDAFIHTPLLEINRSGRSVSGRAHHVRP